MVTSNFSSISNAIENFNLGIKHFESVMHDASPVMLLSSINKSEAGLMTSEVWKVATSYTNKLRAGLTTRDVPSAADTMENIQE